MPSFARSLFVSSIESEISFPPSPPLGASSSAGILLYGLGFGVQALGFRLWGLGERSFPPSNPWEPPLRLASWLGVTGVPL